MNQIYVTFTTEKKYITIYKTIKKYIFEKKLLPNEKLPSKRFLATSLNVSTNTIMAAYNLLLLEGYIFSKEKSGYYISNNIVYPQKVESFVSSKEPETKYLYDFTSENIDITNFPFYSFKKVVNNVLDNNNIWLRRYPLQGSLELRKAIQHHLLQTKGEEISPEDIIIVSSLEESLNIINKLIKIEKVGLEDPSYPLVNRYFSASQKVYFSQDEKGIILNKKQHLDLIYLTPYSQFPLGNQMSLERIKELMQYDISYILEDDYNFDLTSYHYPSLYFLDKSRVFYHGSFSSTLCPGLRISYLIIPHHLINKFHQVNNSNYSHISSLDQDILTKFLNDGYYIRNINKIKKLNEKKSALIKSKLLENHRIKFEQNPLNFIINLNNDLSLDLLKENLNKALIKIKFVLDYTSEKKYHHSLILNYSSIDLNQLPKALDLLNKIILIS